MKVADTAAYNLAMKTPIIATAQTADLAAKYAAALLAQIQRPSARRAKAALKAEALFRASRVDDLVASVQIACAVAEGRVTL